MRPWGILLLLLPALAQAPKPLTVGREVGQAFYPGGRGVAYGEVRLIARGLGLALWQGEGQVALGLGSRYKVFPLVENEAQAAARGAGWKRGQEVFVPLRPLSEALGLEYRAQEGILLQLPWARLLGIERRPERVILRYRCKDAQHRNKGLDSTEPQGQEVGKDKNTARLLFQPQKSSLCHLLE